MLMLGQESTIRSVQTVESGRRGTRCQCGWYVEGMWMVCGWCVDCVYFKAIRGGGLLVNVCGTHAVDAML